MTAHRRRWVSCLLGPALPLVVSAVAVQTPAGPTEFTKVQADRGLTSYERLCARCHGSDLGGNEPAEVPPLEGVSFVRQWSDGPVLALLDKISNTMPADMPRTIERQIVADIASYLLERNGYPAGANELRGDDPALASRVIGTPAR